VVHAEESADERISLPQRPQQTRTVQVAWSIKRYEPPPGMQRQKVQTRDQCEEQRFRPAHERSTLILDLFEPHRGG
jgi:hypothetical protein